jgi:hypothetical protein
MQIDTHRTEQHSSSPAHTLTLITPWAQRALKFVHAWAEVGAGPMTLEELRPLFCLAPRGELAIVVDALCGLGCLVYEDDDSLHPGPGLTAYAPRPSRFAKPS